MRKVKIFLLLGIAVILASCSTIKFKESNTNVSTKIFKELVVSSKSRVSIAVLLPLSGKYKETSENILQAINLSYNTAGNKNLILKIYSTTDNDKNIAKEAATKAISDGADIIIGPLLSESLQQVEKVAEPKNIPVFSFSNDISQLKNTKNTYLAGFSPEVEVERIVDYVVTTKKAKSFVALVPDNKYGFATLLALDASLKARNLELKRYVIYPTDAVSFTSYVEQLIEPESLDNYKKQMEKFNELKNNKELNKNLIHPTPKLDFDTVFIGDFGKRLLLVGVHLPYIDINYSKINIIGTRLWENSNLASENVFYKSMYPSLPNLENTIFQSKFNSVYKQNANEIDAVAYDLIQVVSDLVYVDTETNTLKYDFSKEALSKYKGVGVLGNFNIRPDGLIQRDLIIKSVLPSEDKIIDQSIDYNYMKVQDYKDIIKNGITNKKDDELFNLTTDPLSNINKISFFNNKRSAYYLGY